MYIHPVVIQREALYSANLDAHFFFSPPLQKKKATGPSTAATTLNTTSAKGLSNAATGLSTGKVLGITFGAIFAVIVMVLCITCVCISFKMLRRRKKMWKITQVSWWAGQGQSAWQNIWLCPSWTLCNHATKCVLHDYRKPEVLMSWLEVPSNNLLQYRGRNCVSKYFWCIVYALLLRIVLWHITYITRFCTVTLFF